MRALIVAGLVLVQPVAALACPLGFLDTYDSYGNRVCQQQGFWGQPTTNFYGQDPQPLQLPSNLLQPQYQQFNPYATPYTGSLYDSNN